jgi:hypothetical protein
MTRPLASTNGTEDNANTPFPSAHTRCSHHGIRTYIPHSHRRASYTFVVHIHAVFPSVWFPAPAHSGPVRRVYLYSVGESASTPFSLRGIGRGTSSSGDGEFGDTAMIEDVQNYYQSTSRTADDGSGGPIGGRFSSPEVVCQRYKLTSPRVKPNPLESKMQVKSDCRRMVHTCSAWMAISRPLL